MHVTQYQHSGKLYVYMYVCVCIYNIYIYYSHAEYYWSRGQLLEATKVGLTALAIGHVT